LELVGVSERIFWKPETTLSRVTVHGSSAITAQRLVVVPREDVGIEANDLPQVLDDEGMQADHLVTLALDVLPSGNGRAGRDTVKLNPT
jgi:hypothetical protein